MTGSIKRPRAGSVMWGGGGVTDGEWVDLLYSEAQVPLASGDMDFNQSLLREDLKRLVIGCT